MSLFPPSGRGPVSAIKINAWIALIVAAISVPVMWLPEFTQTIPPDLLHPIQSIGLMVDLGIIVAAICILRLKEWARKAMIAVMVVSVLAGIAYVPFMQMDMAETWVDISNELQKAVTTAYDNLPADNPLRQKFNKEAFIELGMSWTRAIINGLFYFIYLLMFVYIFYVIWFFSRGSVKTLFKVEERGASVRAIMLFSVAMMVPGAAVFLYAERDFIIYDRQRVLDKAYERFAENDPDGALPLYDRILSHDPHDGEARAGRANVFLVKGDLDTAEIEAETAIQDGAKTKGLLARGLAKFFQGDRETGMADIDAVIAEIESKKTRSVDDTETLALALGSKGTSFLMQSRMDEAHAFYLKALETSDDALHHYNLGTWFMFNQKDAEAIPHFTESIERRPSWMAYAHRGYAYARVDRHADSLTDAEKALEWGDTDFALFLRGMARFHLKDFDGAVEDIEAAIPLRNNDPKLQPELERFWGASFESNLARALTQRAITHVEEGRLDEAVADASRATDLLPTLAPTWLVKGQAHRQLGEYEEALASMRRALELDQSYKDRVDAAITGIEADMKKADR